MKDYLVTPTHKNGYKAPGIAVTTAADENPSELAMVKSRLSDFTNWNFDNYKKLQTRSLKAIKKSK